MERKEIFKTLQDIFCDVLDDEDIVLNDDTVADDIEDWDSLTHIQLIVAIEKKFGVKFKSIEIRSLENVGEMVNALQIKLES